MNPVNNEHRAWISRTLPIESMHDMYLLTPPILASVSSFFQSSLVLFTVTQPTERHRKVPSSTLHRRRNGNNQVRPSSRVRLSRAANVECLHQDRWKRTPKSRVHSSGNEVEYCAPTSSSHNPVRNAKVNDHIMTCMQRMTPERPGAGLGSDGMLVRGIAICRRNSNHQIELEKNFKCKYRETRTNARK
ncbi:hypothetical protein BJ508DRAFT_308301 [Ascobolus immersus RN42]|uniref:Uncharacterized protein n=1 Tax=Ascobolus immersus RN42 TaxID=1160509 RepID=A0A3N4I0P4_ASCIM|nr:hypothetical protein BJ508DRAFT_308301 [Ascobolus immersus RN42]